MPAASALSLSPCMASAVMAIIGGLLMSGRRLTSDSGEPDLWSNGSVFMGPREPISIDPSPHIPLQQTTVMALSLVLAGCGGGASGQHNGGGAVSGNIKIEDSSTVYPITQAAAELFREENADARIEVGGAGTSDGFEAFCKGDTQISDASRPIDPAEEVPVCKENGVEYIEIPIAYDGIS